MEGDEAQLDLKWLTMQASRCAALPWILCCRTVPVLLLFALSFAAGPRISCFAITTLLWSGSGLAQAASKWVVALPLRYAADGRVGGCIHENSTHKPPIGGTKSRIERKVTQTTA